MSEVDRFAEEFKKSFDPVVKRVLDSERERVTRPWRIFTAWLLAADLVLTVMFIALFVTWVNR